MASFASSDDDFPLVIDTSVSINLAATGIGAKLLTAIRRPAIVVQAVVDELETGGQRGQIVLAEIERWHRDGLLSIAALHDGAHEAFERLISGSTNETLDDGEAATMAHALSIAGIAVLDDAKANRLAAQHYPDLRLATSVDLIVNDLTVASLGTPSLADAVFAALTGARMRVPQPNLAVVIELLGPDRLAQCHSLPRSARARR